MPNKLKNIKFNLALLLLFSVAFLIFVTACDKKDDISKGKLLKNVHKQKLSVSNPLNSLSKHKLISDPFLPISYKSWEDFHEKNEAFRKKRVMAQNALPINDDGSRVWLGQIVYKNKDLDKQIKTFNMSRKLVKSEQQCAFMKMDGTIIDFDNLVLATEIGKLAAKKYVKIFGIIDDESLRIYENYINVAGMNYIFQNGKLIKETERDYSNQNISKN